jgi:hypothetical protein
MIHPLDQSIIDLLIASRDDEQNLPMPTNDRSYGFHAQQAVEKLLKALISAHGRKYRYTHDISALMSELNSFGETLPVDSGLAQRLTDYAGVWRYQVPLPIPLHQKAEINHLVFALRRYVLTRLDTLRPNINWVQFI